MENKAKIKNTFALNNIELTNEQLDKFNKYYELLIEYNQKFNLTAITQINEVVSKHFVDSVLGYNNISPNEKILDIGCGAGFPSIPLAIMHPDASFTLIDSVGKKIDFVSTVINELALQNCKVAHTRAQEFCTRDNRECYDIVVARALAPMNVLLELCIPFLTQKGKMLAYKGVNYQEEIAQAKNALYKLYAKVEKVQTYRLMGYLDDKQQESWDRYILEIHKTKPTPTIYPRLKNLIKTNPL